MTTTNASRNALRIKHNLFMQKHARKLHKKSAHNECMHDIIYELKAHLPFALIVSLSIALISLYTTLYESGLLEQL